MRGDGINWRGSSGFEAGANFRKLALHMASMVSRTPEYPLLTYIARGPERVYIGIA